MREQARDEGEADGFLLDMVAQAWNAHPQEAELWEFKANSTEQLQSSAGYTDELCAPPRKNKTKLPIGNSSENFNIQYFNLFKI